MKYSDWEEQVPTQIKSDALWKVSVYRRALFLGDLAWSDVEKINQRQRMWALCDQLYRATGSISANLAEGYSRGTGKDRARFYEYALGSARESRDWYYKSRQIIGDEVFQHRLNLLTEIIKLLIKMIPQQRGRILRESATEYQVNSDT